MKIIYSFNKSGFEAAYWHKEIAAASDAHTTFIPFNHGDYLDPNRYIRAQLLDNLYFDRDSDLLRLYADVEALIRHHSADVLLADNCFPYHPEFLRRLHIYKVLRTTDGPLTAYDRDFAYLHAYDHVLYHSAAYSRDLGMAEKLRYCGAKRADFLPLGSFDALCDSGRSCADLLAQQRDLDVVFVGALHLNKMALLAKVKKVFGVRMRLYGVASMKKKLYFHMRYAVPGWVPALPFSKYVPLYQRTKIGINVHNRGDYTVGGYRLFDLPANGVMQLSDGGPYLDQFFDVGNEVVAYRDADELIDKVKYYLSHDEERQRIAAAGWARVRRDYRITTLLRRAADYIRRQEWARQGISEATQHGSDLTS